MTELDEAADIRVTEVGTELGTEVGSDGGAELSASTRFISPPR